MTNLAFPPLPADLENDEQLGNQITLLAGRINAAGHRLLKLIAEFDRRKAWSGGGTVRSCAHWLNWQCGIALVATPDNEDYLITLCRYHHRQLHAGSYSISIVKEAGRAIFRFITPAGANVEASFHPQFPEVCAESFSTALQASAPTVDFETAVTKWRGESCDYGMAIDALISRDAGERFRGKCARQSLEEREVM